MTLNAKLQQSALIFQPKFEFLGRHRLGKIKTLQHVYAQFGGGFRIAGVVKHPIRSAQFFLQAHQ